MTVRSELVYGAPKITRRTLLSGLAAGVLLTSTRRPAFASTTAAAGMDYVDLMLAAHRELAAVDSTAAEAPMWSSLTGVRSLEPLYGPDGSVAAYHLGFEPGGYAVVNNNLLNPVLLEYSSEDHPAPESLTAQFLLSPPDGSDEETGRTAGEALSPLSFAASLRAGDPAAARAHARERAMLARLEVDVPEVDPLDDGSVMTSFGGDYGFLNLSGLPNQSYTGKILSSATSVSKWGTTGEFAGVNGAKDHCGATAAFNVVLYYRTRYGRSSLMLSTRSATFTALHKHIGNGPVTFLGLTGGLKKYVASRNSSITCTSNGGYSNIKTQLTNNKMVVILLSSGLFSWHFVCGIGFREYSGGSKFIRVIDGWNNSADRFIRSSNLVGSYVTHIT